MLEISLCACHVVFQVRKSELRFQHLQHIYACINSGAALMKLSAPLQCLTKQENFRAAELEGTAVDTSTAKQSNCATDERTSHPRRRSASKRKDVQFERVVYFEFASGPSVPAARHRLPTSSSIDDAKRDPVCLSTEQGTPLKGQPMHSFEMGHNSLVERLTQNSARCRDVFEFSARKVGPKVYTCMQEAPFTRFAPRCLSLPNPIERKVGFPPEQWSHSKLHQFQSSQE